MVSKDREVDPEKVLEHELACITPAPFYDNGTMKKTAKADLAGKIEG